MDGDEALARAASPLDEQPPTAPEPTEVMAGEIAAIHDGEPAGNPLLPRGDADEAADDDDMFGDGGEGSGQESAGSEAEKPSQPKKKSKKARRREREEDGGDERAGDGDGGPSDLPQMSEQDRRRVELARKIELAAKGPKKRPRKKADETDLEAAADDEVVRMRDMMQAAAMEDRQANEEGRPATAKLRLLRDAVDTLQKTGYQQAILDNNLLEAVRMWLEPLPDKSLPSLNIQRAIFPLLDRMYIDSTSLKMSRLGRVVLFYTRCNRVDRSINRIAERLLESWSRPILKRSSSYRDRTQAGREFAADGARSLQRAAQSSQAARAATASSQRARIPESVTGNAFQYAPITTASDQLDDAQLAKLAEKQRINKFKRSMAAAKR